MKDYFIDGNKFVIKDYDIKKPFYSFMPGIAGRMGIPLWNFYLNRGQAVASFGTKDKDGAILEFNSSITAVQKIETKGFRTFLKWNGVFYEPFGNRIKREGLQRNMYITPAGLQIEESNTAAGYRIVVTYGTLPNEGVSGLIRDVALFNIGETAAEAELLDGITMMLPYGMTYHGFKDEGNLFRSWTDVYQLENDFIFTKQRSSTADCAEVTVFEKGNYYISYVNGSCVRPIADNDLIFGQDFGLRFPQGFLQQDVQQLAASEQITANKIPCGFTPAKTSIKPGQSLTVHTLIGHAESPEEIQKRKQTFAPAAYIQAKLQENEQIINDLTADIETTTAFPLFDGYVKQSYLDNLLRGGYPVKLENKKDGFVYYLYSRKHGDMERDYNWFSIMPEFYSQGNGAYRDINQNRRNDVFFNPFVRDYSIRQFLSLIQLDGYNPLEVKGASFRLMDKKQAQKLAGELANGDRGLCAILSGLFTPGSIINYLSKNGVQTALSHEELLTEILSVSEQNFEAQFGEGYWIDHWTYIFDLIESYEGIYPDQMEQLLFGNKAYRYFYSPVYVLPRAKKYILNGAGTPRQYSAIDPADTERLMRKSGGSLQKTDWVKKQDGSVYQTDMASKLFALALIKFTLLDSGGMGIEMEGDKVGWNDAMNGLAGLFGSGVSETIELCRVLRFLSKQLRAVKGHKITLLQEQYDLLQEVLDALQSNLSDFDYWDRVATARETFRLVTAEGICSGKEAALETTEVCDHIARMLQKLERGLAKAKEMGGGIYPGYLVYDAIEYDMMTDGEGKQLYAHNGLPLVKVKRFAVRPLPKFLEAAARSFKIEDSQACAAQYSLIKNSDLYDHKAGLYKTCEDLSAETFEIGRIKQFTPGYLERESCFLHMTYKYLYGQLKAGLYEQFYADLKTNFVAFMDPQVYGRSVLENSTFIVPTVNPDKNMHGQGFFARLTGANAEVLSMWCLMMYGAKPFVYDGELVFAPRPKLSADFFDEKGEVRFRLMGKIEMVYKNPGRRNTYETDCAVRHTVLYCGKERHEFLGEDVRGPWAEKIRDCAVDRIEILLG